MFVSFFTLLQANNDKKLSELGIVDGSILKVDDFLQNYNLTIGINHYVAKEKDDPPYKVVADPNDLKPSVENGRVYFYENER